MGADTASKFSLSHSRSVLALFERHIFASKLNLLLLKAAFFSTSMLFVKSAACLFAGPVAFTLPMTLANCLMLQVDPERASLIRSIIFDAFSFVIDSLIVLELMMSPRCVITVTACATLFGTLMVKPTSWKISAVQAPFLTAKATVS